MNTNIHCELERLLQKLISFDTSNPPGRERDCLLYIKGLLDEAGIETSVYSLDENRPNLRAVIRAENPAKPPLLLYGHIDTVPASPEGWTHPPFSGVKDGGFIYGRGAVDMKSAIAMFIFIMLRIKREGIRLGFDLILLVLSDEEDTGKYGAKFLIEKHPRLFDNIAFAVGEVGGYSLHFGGKRFYPVAVAEKQCAALKLTFRGMGGHGAARHRGTAVEKLSAAAVAFSRYRLKTRVTPEAAFMLRELAKGLGGVKGLIVKLLAVPSLTDTALNLMGVGGLLFDNLLHNSVNVTIVRGGEAVNVVPPRAEAAADLRVLPGCALETALEDVRELLRKRAGLSPGDYELEVTEFDENSFKPDLSYFDLFRKALAETDPEGIPVPFVLGAATDGRILSRAGVMTYGFVPMRLPEGFDFTAALHAVDERLPVEALGFGAETLFALLRKYGGDS